MRLHEIEVFLFSKENNEQGDEIADRMRESPGYLFNMGLKFEYIKNSKN